MKSSGEGSIWPVILIPLLITGFTAFIFEAVVPMAEEAEIYQYHCEIKGGVVMSTRETGKICLKKENIINVY